jgi:hypothetical protein
LFTYSQKKVDINTKAFFAMRKKVIVYTTADNMQYRLAATDTLSFAKNFHTENILTKKLLKQPVCLSQ